MRDYYGDAGCPGDVFHGRIAVKEENGRIVSMVHLKPVTAVYECGSDGPREVPVTYLMCIATLPACRHRGYMDEVMKLVMDTLRREDAPWCFLIAVDRQIYRHLHFDCDWKLSQEEADLLYADEGLDTASACLLNDTVMLPPDRICASL